MTDIFISFKSSDTPQVGVIRELLRARGHSIFWSNDIPTGAENYQTVIIDALSKSLVVLVVWTKASVESTAVVQECMQAQIDGKLIQIVLDDIPPIQFPMDVNFKAQKAFLIGWGGEPKHPEWQKLVSAIERRLPATSAVKTAATYVESDRQVEVDLNAIRKILRANGQEPALLRAAELAISHAQKDYRFAERVLDKLLRHPEFNGREPEYPRGKLLFDSTCRAITERVNDIVGIVARHPHTDIWPWVEEMIIA
jgi:hypothetical protein